MVYTHNGILLTIKDEIIPFAWMDLEIIILKKEFIGPGLRLRPVHADRARPPLQWALNSVFGVYGNDDRRIRPPPDR